MSKLLKGLIPESNGYERSAGDLGRTLFSNGFPVYLILCTFGLFAMLSLVGVHYELLPTSEQQQHPHINNEFMLEVAASGETVFVAAKGVSAELAEELLSTVYPSPEAAMLAVRGESITDYLGPRPAEAHAVRKCTRRDGVKSLDTGGGYHLTYHRFDRNGYRYTKTYHMVYSYPGHTATDVFYAKINKRYC